MSGSKEQFNTQNIASRYSESLLPVVEPIRTCTKDIEFASKC